MTTAEIGPGEFYPVVGVGPHPEPWPTERYFDLEKLKGIPSYSSVLNNPKRGNFLTSIYAAAGEKVQPPVIINQPSISEFEEYINKMQKSYKTYMNQAGPNYLQ